MNDEWDLGNDRALNRAIAEFQSMPVPPSPGPDVLLSRLPTQSQLLIPASNRRSFLMRHAYHVITVAAALLIFAMGWLVLTWPSSIALADVIEATKNHKIVRYNLTTSAEIKAKVSADQQEEFVAATSQDVVYVDLTSPRLRIERHEKTFNSTVQSDWVTVQDNQEDRTLVLSSLALIVTEDEAKDQNQIQAIKMFKNGGHAGKRARLFRVSDEGLKPFTNMKTDKTFLDVLQGFQDGTDVISTREVLDGRDATRFQLDQQDMTAILWVDEKTKLPIRIEQELLNPRPNVKRWKWVLTDFEWNLSIDNLDDFFSTKPPADYVLEDHTNDS